MRIERSHPSDAPDVEALLSAAGLPVAGVAAALSAGVVAREGDRVIGAAAVERFGRAGLLRSVVVAAGHRGSGVGRRLVEAAEDVARAEGIGELYLLTETAAGWFPRLGYEVVPRGVAEAAVGESVEVSELCAATSIAMRHVLGRVAKSRIDGAVAS